MREGGREGGKDGSNAMVQQRQMRKTDRASMARFGGENSLLSDD